MEEGCCTPFYLLVLYAPFHLKGSKNIDRHGTKKGHGTRLGHSTRHGHDSLRLRHV